MIDDQNKNWKVITAQFDAIQGNFYVLRDCNQTLFFQPPAEF